ncbi:MAG: NHLP leader peptide family natural product precursor [Nostoc sp. GBBB01]|uniref:NHLP leader peptide family natural product n=1 Tax=Nostoc punctiforme FACHB-252 TaxID=1357509 RepID=A0ABR8H3F4_NOSPU|nr:NHLP leader peptide family RiPP precursor [Nostoc punctiforme]MBD2610064.1 NHLP leader peptide family natural product precursor [Nostoc punctiforme FACHB-252]MBL1197731.1 NHLP leader peptide family natural product precursor [Nostoc sp. GBBB01]
MFEIKAQMLTQAVQDSHFRSRLIANPLAVAAEYGWNIPTQTQITVVEETPSHYYLVLPALGTQDLANQTPENSDVNSTAHMLEIEVQLLARAAQDVDFRNDLIADPKTVMAQKGLNFPNNIQVSVLEETANSYYLVLPALDFSELEANRDLSDAELELVAGGADTQNHSWTGCASGQSGCVATKGCDAAIATVGVTLAATAAF